MRGIEIRGETPGRAQPGLLRRSLSRSIRLINGHHRSASVKRWNWSSLGELDVDSGQHGIVHAPGVAGAGPEALIIDPRTESLEERFGLGGRQHAIHHARDGDGRGRAVLAVVAVDIDGAGQIADRLGDRLTLLFGDTVIAEREMDVMHSVAMSCVDIKGHPVNADDGFDAQCGEFLEPRVTGGEAATDDLSRWTRKALEVRRSRCAHGRWWWRA